MTATSIAKGKRQWGRGNGEGQRANASHMAVRRRFRATAGLALVLVLAPGRTARAVEPGSGDTGCGHDAARIPRRLRSHDSRCDHRLECSGTRYCLRRRPVPDLQGASRSRDDAPGDARRAQLDRPRVPALRLRATASRCAPCRRRRTGGPRRPGVAVSGSAATPCRRASRWLARSRRALRDAAESSWAGGGSGHPRTSRERRLDLPGTYEFRDRRRPYQTTPPWNGFVAQPGFRLAKPFTLERPVVPACRPRRRGRAGATRSAFDEVKEFGAVDSSVARATRPLMRSGGWSSRKAP